MGLQRASPLAVLERGLAGARTPHAVPLLVLRLTDLPEIAWRAGRRAALRQERATTRAFLAACARLFRTADIAAHDPGSEFYAVAMLARPRSGSQPSSAGCRAAVERIAAAVSLQAGRLPQTGWTAVERADRREPLRQHIEAALDRSAREQERYSFFATVGHELRTPLASIRGYLQTLLEEEADAATARRFLETAQREALRMGRLLEGMFEFSMLDVRPGAERRTECSLGEQIALACEVVGPFARSRSVTVKSVRSCVQAAIDPDACLQLIVNLLQNAVNHGRAGGCVSVRARRRGANAILRVDDDGPGVTAAEREAIFELGARGSVPATSAGAGIGLTIVKTIAERFDGRARASASPMGGARFEVVLPAGRS